jgi:flavorubredoxin
LPKTTIFFLSFWHMTQTPWKELCNHIEPQDIRVNVFTRTFGHSKNIIKTKLKKPWACALGCPNTTP